MKSLAILSVISVLALIVVAGCSNDDDAPAASSSSTAASASSAALPANLVVTEAPPEAQDVTAVMKNAKDGDAVVIRGKIGGREEPLAKNRAIMTVLDP